MLLSFGRAAVYPGDIEADHKRAHLHTKTGCDGGLNKCPAGIRSDDLPQPIDIAYLEMAGSGDGIHFSFHRQAVGLVLDNT